MKIKKFLSVMLVLVLVLGFIPLTAIAADKTSADDYTDADDITPALVEAVDVLTAIKAIQGNPDDSLDPQGAFTRAMAVVIAANLALGRAVSDSLPGGATGFTDVDGHSNWTWAVPAIKWAVDNGILLGRGEGIFDPGGEITTVEIAILLLKLLGYGQNGEYEGAAWATNGQVDGMRFGILDLGISAGTVAKREEVIWYALNALLSPMVEYNAFMGVYYPIGQNPITGQFPPNVGPTTLGGRVFNLSTKSSVNDLGYLEYKYYVGNAPIVGPFLDKNAGVPGYFQFVTDSTHTRRAMNNIGGGYKWEDDVSLFVNGWELEFYDFTMIANPASTALAFPTGALVSLYADEDGVIIRVVVIYEVLGKVTAVSGDDITVDVYDRFYNAAANPDANGNTHTVYKFPADGFVKDDFILIVPVNGDIDGETSTTISSLLIPDKTEDPWSVAPATSIIATVTRTVASTGHAASVSSLTADGVVYNKFSAGRALGRNDTPGFTGETEFFFDSNDLVIGFRTVTAAEGAKDYVYLRNAVYEPGNALAGRPTVARAAVTYTDGSKANVDLDVNSNGDIRYNDGSTVATASSLTSLPNNTFYSFTMVDGAMRLGVLVATEATATSFAQATKGATITLTGGNASGTSLATSNTKFSLATDGEIEKTTTGFANFPSFTNGGKYTGQVLLVYTNASKAALSEVYIIREAAPSADEVIIIVSLAATVPTGFEYNIVRENGDKTIILENKYAGDNNTFATISTTAGKTNATEVTPTESNVFVSHIDAGYLVIFEDDTFAPMEGTPTALAANYLLSNAVAAPSSGRIQVGSEIDIYCDDNDIIIAIIIRNDP